MRTDILIVGNGIAALSLVNHLSEFGIDKSIIMLSDQPTENTNSYFAQGGIAVEFGGEKKKKSHISDTINCGVINNKTNTSTILCEAENSLNKIIKLGLNFELDGKGNLSKRREGGHSTRRILYHSDITGKFITDFLKGKLRENHKVKVLENRICFKLLKDGNSCIGTEVYNLKSDKIENIYASKVILSTGGCGALYKFTSNSHQSIGSGISLSNEIGANISNMEFIQFHPTAFVNKKKTILISEALRGEGATIENREGKTLEKVELLTRDKLSRLLYEGIRQGEEYFLNCTKIPDKILSNFDYIRSSLLSFGIDIKTTLIPINPVAHYMCGGITTDVTGKTNIDNLYAIGETADTGLHGANRLASNSLTEAVTVPYLLTSNLMQSGWREPKVSIRNQYIIDKVDNYDEEIRKLRKLMWGKCGIVRTDNNQKELLEYIKIALSKLLQSSNINKSKIRYKMMLDTAKIIVESSINRTENVGTFWKIKNTESIKK